MMWYEFSFIILPVLSSVLHLFSLNLSSLSLRCIVTKVCRVRKREWVLPMLAALLFLIFWVDESSRLGSNVRPICFKFGKYIRYLTSVISFYSSLPLNRLSWYTILLFKRQLVWAKISFLYPFNIIEVLRLLIVHTYSLERLKII